MHRVYRFFNTRTGTHFYTMTAIDQYGATLARWFGVPSAQLSLVFPNLAAFPSADLGFLR